MGIAQALAVLTRSSETQTDDIPGCTLSQVNTVRGQCPVPSTNKELPLQGTERALKVSRRNGSRLEGVNRGGYYTGRGGKDKMRLFDHLT